MYMTIAGLILLVPRLLGSIPQPCDQQCREVIRAALTWTVESVPTENREKLFVDFSPLRRAPALETEEMRQFAAATTEVARGMGLRSGNSREDEAWSLCLEAPGSAACRSHAGKTGITVRSVDFLSATEATAIVLRIRIENSPPGARSATQAIAWDLRLTRSGEDWAVTDAKIRGQS